MNVLAVMTEAAALHGDNGDPIAKAVMIDARDVVADLVKRADEAAYRLEAMAREFSSSNFTDRYGDGPACKERAENLRAALSKATA